MMCQELIMFELDLSLLIKSVITSISCILYSRGHFELGGMCYKVIFYFFAVIFGISPMKSEGVHFYNENLYSIFEH